MFEIIIFIIICILISQSKSKNKSRSRSQSPARNMMQQLNRALQEQKPAKPNRPAHPVAKPNQPQTRPQPTVSEPVYRSEPVNMEATSYKRPVPTGQGMRYEEWQPVPKGCRIVKCHYCGAGNAVAPHMGNKVARYFCREIL